MHKIINGLLILVVIALFVITKTELVSFDKVDLLNGILLISIVILMNVNIYIKKREKINS